MKMTYQIDQFIMHCVAKSLSKKTYRSYEQTLVLFARYLEEEQGIKDAEMVTTKVINEYIDYMRHRGKYTVVGKDETYLINYPENRTDYGKKVSDITINNYIRNIKVFFSYLCEFGEIRSNPAKKVKHIKVARKPLQFLSDDEFKKLMDGMDLSKLHEYRDFIIIRTLLDTGMRIGECLSIHVEDLDLKENAIFLHAENTKGKQSRYVFFSTKLAMELKRWLRYKDRYLESNLLFPTTRASAMQVTNFESNLKKYAKRVGLSDIHPHCFRNNFSKRFLMNGGNIYVLSQILGHSSVQVTEQAYLDLDSRDLQKQYTAFSPLANMKRQ